MKDIQIDYTNLFHQIKEFPIFRQLLPEQFEKFLLERNIMLYKKNSFAYYQGSRITGIYCIVEGILKVYKTGIDGKEQIIRFAKPGEIIGFRSVLSGELACTTSKIIENSMLCFIPSEALIYLVKNNGNFAMDLLQLVCLELGEANSYITDIAQKTVRERLAEILLQLKDNFHLDKDNYLQITLTREELANIIGTATESVIRLLSEFKADHLIELDGRKIKIINIAALTKIANLYN
jgi:CRP/FNR family transcriptional regulator, polysaccharide utilization system transcription regulator